jgi:hypothetical protein
MGCTVSFDALPYLNLANVKSKSVPFRKILPKQGLSIGKICLSIPIRK